MIDIIFNNAGVSFHHVAKTDDGFETDIQTNYLGHFLLTMLLLPLLKKSTKARVISVSGGIYIVTKLHLDNINMEGMFEPMTTYAHSKLAQILFTRELARRLGKDSNVNVYVLHPGVIESEFDRNMPAGAPKSPVPRISVELGAQTTLYCALEESLDNETGLYYE